MSREIRRLHRKQKEFTNFSSSKSLESSNLTGSTEHSTESNSDAAYSPQPQIVNHSTAHINDINAIRAEFLEDAYHSKLSESDYSDDTHDWGGDGQDISDDYWHFVGSFD